jgi:excisionase family DNA binding protein
MKPHTSTIVQTALAADESIPKHVVNEAMAVLRRSGRIAAKFDKLLVTQAESARLLSVSRYTVNRMVNAGTLPTVCIRGAKRYRVSDLQKLARYGEQTGDQLD